VPAVGGEHEARIRAELDEAGIGGRHTVVDVDPIHVVARFAELGLHISSMGRPAEEDPVLFEAAAAAGVLAAERTRL
jgi:hypothetical protein